MGVAAAPSRGCPFLGCSESRGARFWGYAANVQSSEPSESRGTTGRSGSVCRDCVAEPAAFAPWWPPLYRLHTVAPEGGAMTPAGACKGVRADGAPCRTPERFVDPATGFCPSHAPGAAERLSEAGKKGAEATARKWKGKALDDDDLPPLVDHDAAEAWLEAAGRAVATGNLGHNAGATVIRSVREWIRAHEAGSVSDRLDALMGALAEWRETGDAAPVLELVARHGATSDEGYSRYADNPVGFIRDVLGAEPWTRQVEIAEAVRDRPLVTVRSCHAAGKDWLAARLALWWVYARHGLVVMTGPTAAQVEEILMRREVATAFEAGDLPGELHVRALRPAGGGKAGVLARTATGVHGLTGLHEPRVLFVITEAQDPDLSHAFDAAFACATGADDRIVTLGNPTEPDGRFYRAHRPGSDWHAVKIAAKDVPNVTEGRTVVPGLLAREGRRALPKGIRRIEHVLRQPRPRRVSVRGVRQPRHPRMDRRGGRTPGVRCARWRSAVRQLHPRRRSRPPRAGRYGRGHPSRSRGRALRAVEGARYDGVG